MHELAYAGPVVVRFRRRIKPGRYGVRLYRHPDRPVVLIVTDGPDNPGPTLVNGIERVADQLCERFAIDPATLLFVEHTPAGSWNPADVYTRVSFELRDDERHYRPRWHPIRPADVERWIGRRLVPLPNESSR